MTPSDENASVHAVAATPSGAATVSGRRTPPAQARVRAVRGGLWLALVAVVALAYWAVAAKASFPVGFWSDDATYVATARSLAEGTGYRHIQIPSEPLQTRYPPLYPALLSLGFGFGQDYPENRSWLLLPGAIAASALWLLSLVYWRRVFEAPTPVLLCAGALTLVSPVVLAFVRYTMSDLVYGALSVGALLCLDSHARSHPRSHPKSNPERDSALPASQSRALLVGGALLIALSMLTRSIGITLLPAALIALVVRRRFAQAGIVLAVVLLCCAPWWAWQLQAAAQNGGLQTAFMTSADLSYGLWLPESASQLVEVLRQNSLRLVFSVANYQLALPRAFVEAALASPSWHTALLFGVSTLAVALCAVGFVASLRHRWTALHVYLLLYGGLIWLWPFEPHRFLVPLTPFILYFLMSGVWLAASRAAALVSGHRVPPAGGGVFEPASRWAGGVAVAVAFALGIFFLAEDARIATGRSQAVFIRELAGEFDADELVEVCAWIDREIPATGVIASASPGGVYLHSGNRGYFIWPDADPYRRYYGSDREAWRFYGGRSRSERLSVYDEMVDQFRELYADVGIGYYLHQPHWLEAGVMDQVAALHPDVFELLYTSASGDYRVYRLDGLGSPLQAKAASASPAARAGVPLGSGPADPRPNIVLITIESLRTDHMGFQGARNDTTPFLDAFAGEAVVYENAHAVTSWTLPSHASIFTGLYPPAHQAVGPTGTLHRSHSTTAEILRAAGYQTAGVVSGPYLRRTHRLHQGFEIYDDSIAGPARVASHGDVTNPAMLEALERFLTQQRDSARPFFLFAYFWDPHYDYKPPAPYDAKFRTAGDRAVDLSHYEDSDVLKRGASQAERAYVLSQYDGEIAATDQALQHFFDSLRREGLWRNTAIIVTSDHGEEFLDHGEKGHKNNLFVESVHVPLVIKYPALGDDGASLTAVPAAGTRRRELVSLVDLHPTIVELAGGSTHDVALGHGQSLLAPNPDANRAIYFDLKYVWFDPDPDADEPVVLRQLQAVRRGDFKLIKSRGKAGAYLFDVSLDPREQHNLSRSARTKAHKKSLEQDLRRWREEMEQEQRGRKRGAEAVLDQAEKARLRALGYIE